MSINLPQYPKTNFPNSLDNYIIFTDVNASNKPYVDLYYQKLNANDFAGATQVLNDHIELKYVIINANTLQTIYDALMAIETTYSTDIIQTIGSCVTSQGEWNSTRLFPLFSIVTNNGKAYMCKKKDCPIGTPVNNTEFWLQMSIVGESGSGMSFHTSYEPSQNYKIQDCVPYGNKLYVAIRDNYNKEPSVSPDDWKSVVTVPRQIITSELQPENQEPNDIWCEILE